MVPCPRRLPHSIFGLLLRWLAELLRALIPFLAETNPPTQID
jgi:hypothetical protein